MTDKETSDKWERDIKRLYAMLYAQGMNKEKVTLTMKQLCDCVGAWSVSRLTDEQITTIGKFIDYFKPL
jgi:hypothetical protein